MMIEKWENVKEVVEQQQPERGVTEVLVLSSHRRKQGKKFSFINARKKHSTLPYACGQYL